MSDSERPHPQTASFEVPDLELEPAPRSIRRGLPSQPAPGQANRSTPAAQTLGALQPRAAAPNEQLFGATFDFGDDLGTFEVERTAQPNFEVSTQSVAIAQPVNARTTALEPSLPTGRAPDLAKLVFDPREIAILADYGEAPNNAAATLAYAYRVFVRQRELKRQLVPLAAESKRAEDEREATLCELARTLRPALEQIAEFRRLLAPILEIEGRAAARGQALDSINAQLGAHNAELEAELARTVSGLEAEQRAETDAQREYEERQTNESRIEAKLKRVQIEIRAVTQVAEQKLGPAGGPLPAAESAQIAELEQRAQAMQPELNALRNAVERAHRTLNQARARVEGWQQSQRQIARKKQALSGAYAKELSLRAEGVTEVELEARAALVELALAVLGAPDAVTLPDGWRERVRRISERADALTVRAEMFRRAVAAYDARRARQGVQLACTAAGLMLAWFAFKLIF
jgi:hypothetical protein